MKNRILVACGVAASAFFATASNASLIMVESNEAASTENLGTFSGSLNYTALTATTGTLAVSLANTTPGARGGRLTAFAFNIHSVDSGASANLTSTNTLFLNAPNASGSPFGSFTGGAGLGGTFLGGGSPNNGLAIGATGLFTFAIVASDASLLSASSFILGPTPPNFVVRFRGFNNGGSDKVPAEIVPAPATLALLGLGAFAARRRR